MENFMIILLMAGGEGGPSPMINLLFFAAIIVVMYFFMIRPQTKKAKKQKRFINQVERGDNVVTSGGIHGKVIKEQEKTFIIEVQDGTRFEVERSALSMENTQAHYEKNDDDKKSKEKDSSS